MIQTSSPIDVIAKQATRPGATANAAAQSPGKQPAQGATIASGFNGYLDKELSPTATPEEKLKHLSKMYVSNAMIMPLFEQMRSDPLAANLVHGGRGEKIFQQQMDQILSDRIAGSAGFGIADAVYKQLSANMKGAGLSTHG